MEALLQTLVEFFEDPELRLSKQMAHLSHGAAFLF
jgi:hypothetical protein